LPSPSAKIRNPSTFAIRRSTTLSLSSGSAHEEQRAAADPADVAVADRHACFGDALHEGDHDAACAA
jgi:hypothetical protein